MPILRRNWSGRLHVDKKPYDFAVFIGRFNPLHLGHQRVINNGLLNARHVIVLIGSADGTRNIRNPFTYEERYADMIFANYRHEITTGMMTVLPLPDRPYAEEAWIASVQELVNKTILRVGNEMTGTKFHNHGTRDFKVALCGYKKDGTSYYLKLFPEWEFIEGQPGGSSVLNSTDIRADYFTHNPRLPHDTCSPAVIDFMRDFMETDDFKNLVEEAEFVQKYKDSWKSAPFPPTFVTVDVVVIQSGHVLMIRRGGNPGKGQLALPGGFLDQSERIRDGAIRELCEETAISRQVPGKERFEQIPSKVLGGYIDDSATRVFDYPQRSTRGRTITHAFLFRLPDSRPMFQVKGSDDAAWAGWIPLGELNLKEIYEDHAHIIQEMVRL
jgi:bifunctional NMN adenylyltransferase/nudix hydrolase